MAAKKTTKKKAPAKKKAPVLSEAEQAAQAQIAEAKKAEKAAAQQKAIAEKAKAKAKAEAEKAKAREVTEKALVSVAQKINGRFDVIARAQSKVDDHRLAAALEIAAAKEQCREGGINFKDWAIANIKKQSYETVRKLLPIGVAEAEKPGEGAKMLTDMREKNASANKKARAAKSKGEGEGEGEGEASGKDSEKAKTKARLAVDALDKPDWEEFMETQAKVGERVLVSNEDAELVTGRPLDRAKTAFGRLTAKAKVDFATWVAGEVGATLAMNEDESSEIPF